MSIIPTIEKKKLNLTSFVNKAYTEGVYADTPQNRKLGRVGMSYAEYAEKVKKEDGGEKVDFSDKELRKFLGTIINPKRIDSIEKTWTKDVHGTVYRTTFWVRLKDKNYIPKVKLEKIKDFFKLKDLVKVDSLMGGPENRMITISITDPELKPDKERVASVKEIVKKSEYISKLTEKELDDIIKFSDVKVIDDDVYNKRQALASDYKKKLSEGNDIKYSADEEVSLIDEMIEEALEETGHRFKD